MPSINYNPHHGRNFVHCPLTPSTSILPSSPDYFSAPLPLRYYFPTRLLVFTWNFEDSGLRAFVPGLTVASAKVMIASSLNELSTRKLAAANRCQKPFSSYITLITEWREDVLHKSMDGVVWVFPFGPYRSFKDWMALIVGRHLILSGDTERALWDFGRCKQVPDSFTDWSRCFVLLAGLRTPRNVFENNVCALWDINVVLYTINMTVNYGNYYANGQWCIFFSEKKRSNVCTIM